MCSSYRLVIFFLYVLVNHLPDDFSTNGGSMAKNMYIILSVVYFAIFLAPALLFELRCARMTASCNEKIWWKQNSCSGSASADTPATTRTTHICANNVLVFSRFIFGFFFFSTSSSQVLVWKERNTFLCAINRNWSFMYVWSVKHVI